MNISRQSVDLTAYPDLVVVYLGMKAHTFGGFIKLIKLRPRIMRAASAGPDGLLHHEENIIMSLFPLHIGMRQYWRDFDSLERWTREMPHMGWWKDLIARPQGVSVWHETYCLRGGIDSVFLASRENGSKPGLLAFAPNVDAASTMLSARRRLRREGAGTPPVSAE